MWIEFITRTDIGDKSYGAGRRLFVSERNGETLIKAKKAKAVGEDTSGPAKVRTGASAKPAKVKKEK